MGSFDWNKIKLPEGYTYLGHNQSPTSSARKWKEHTSHPFECNNWVVAHNGVLTNFEVLKKEYIPDHSNVVDTSIIPALLSKFEAEVEGYKTKEDEIKGILKVLSKLEGTFGLWIFNINTMNVYITRQGSTLFHDHNSFSSTPGSEYVPLTEGTLYLFNLIGTIPVGTFKSKSPFLEL